MTRSERVPALRGVLASLFSIAAIGGLSLLLGGCATIFDGPRPTLTIKGEPSPAAAFEDGSNTKLGNTPLDLYRRPAALRIRLERLNCEKQSFQLRRRFNRTSIWNLVNLPGWLIDLASGHLWEFEPSDLQHYTLSCVSTPEIETTVIKAESAAEPEDVPLYYPRGDIEIETIPFDWIADIRLPPYPLPLPLPQPPVLISDDFSGPELSAIYSALANLAEDLSCPVAIPHYWRVLADTAADLGAGGPPHHGPEDFAEALAAEMESMRQPLAEFCRTPPPSIAQCSALLEKPLTPEAAPGTTLEPPDSIFFGFNQADVDSLSPPIRQLAQAVESADGVLSLLLTGFADPVGTPQYNRSLGCRRARALREALVREGLSRNLILTETMGEDRSYQLAPDKGGSSEGADLNRRVVIQLIPFVAGDEHDCAIQ